MPQHWLQITFEAAAPQALEEALWTAGAEAVTFSSAGAHEVLEPAPGATPLWERVQVTALFPAETNMHEVCERIELALGACPAHRAELLEDRDWVREWLVHFKPMRFGRRLWICPTAHEVAEADAAVVMLDPGLAFGTGTHASTALCLEWLDGAELAGKRVLDYGCGSGILAVAAARLGAAGAVATDIDPQALHATRENARRNALHDHIEVLPPSELGPQAFDIVLANILAGPLIELAPALSARVKPGGWLVLAGLLAEQAAGVGASYAAWIDWQVPVMREQWTRLAGRRR